MFKILESPNKKEDMTNLHRYYKDRKDDINSSIRRMPWGRVPNRSNPSAAFRPARP